MSGPAGASPTWTDSHCHTHDEDDPEAALARAAAAGIGAVVCVGTGPDSARRAVALAAAAPPTAGWPRVYASVGLHPHDAVQGTAATAALLDELCNGVPPGPKAPGTVVAVGECGLDYFYERSPRAAQRQAFVDQIALAKRLDLSLVIHTRDAWEDTFSILRDEGLAPRTVIHCFTGGPDEAVALVELGAYLSFSGIATFKNAADVRAAAVDCPADRILVETDAPYLAPVPHRGTPNEPAYVALVGAALAALRRVDASEFAALTTANAVAAFALSR
jgi:TatD DNase family protein